MESILVIALYFIKKFVYYIILSSLALLGWVIILSFIVSIIRRKSVNLKRYNILFLTTFITFINGIIIDYFLYKRVFTNFIDIIISVSVFIVIGLIGNVVLSLLKFEKHNKVIKEDSAKISIPYIEKPKSVEILSCIEKPVSVYGGYIDVTYLKGLIDSIKEKNLEYDDEKEIEELEVYLLNFVNRQPNGYERQKLSSYVESLIKKLAKYNVI